MITDVKQWEDTITALSFEDARRELMKLKGVGPKAADCILLFALEIRGVPGRCLDTPDNAEELSKNPEHYIRTHGKGI
jgi:hypothetical protein